MAGADDLHAHLAGGCTTVARCWAITRRDGVRLGFTDHDADLAFDGLVFRAGTGLTARALETSTGLSVDNSEAMGALSDAAIREADIAAGRYDGAEVVAWMVNWADVAARKVIFRGTLGEIRRGGGAFHAELRGLSEALNRPFGRVYQKVCDAVLGDSACGVDTSDSALSWEGPVEAAEEGRRLWLGSAHAEGWFTRGSLTVLTGEAAGLSEGIKRDLADPVGRRIDLWTPVRAEIVPGDMVRLVAGCDKRVETCREKFGNLLNFQGFPDIPEEDWMTVSPAHATARDGGSRR